MTGRLVLRAATVADRAAVRRLLTDPDARRYLGGPLSEADADAAAARPPGQHWGSFVIERDGETIGGCSLDRDRGELEVSYALLPEHWGQGFGAEAVRAVLGWAHANTADDHVIAVTQAANEPSRRLLERLGFVPREEFVEYDAPQVLAEAPVARFAVSPSGT
ncbi:MAG: [ribosomal protein S5]-alanine N-acetyltransferase [Mycobacteriales bacterium]